MDRKKRRRYTPKPEEVKKSQEEIRRFYRKALQVLEEERRRISRDLHDETGQTVIALGARLNVIEKEIKTGNYQKALTLIDEDRKLIQDIAARMKAMALYLRPPALDILGLPAVLREYFAQFTKSRDIKVVFNENLKEAVMDRNLQITLYRVIQEAIINILKHSQAATVHIDLILGGKEIELLIEDDGKGFDVKEYEQRYDLSKIGLRGIKERVELLNGKFSLESALGKGTKLLISFPL